MVVELSMAVGEYDHTQPLLSGEITAKGIDLTVLDYASPKRHRRMLESKEFDICEMSMGSYLASRSEKNDYPFTAIPVFPHRRFRHSYMFKNADADISDPGDLSNKNVGLRGWQVTSTIWMRGIAREHYGADLESINWHVHDGEDVDLDLSKYSITEVSDGDTFEEMLISGELDAALYPNLLESVKSPETPVERIFADSLTTEEEYYKSTGIFPIMHTVVIKDEVIEKHPWVAVNIYDAFQEARNLCLQKLEDPRWTALAWARQHLEHQQSVLGTNPYPYGLTDESRNNLNTLIGYAYNQKVIPEKYNVDDLFVDSTLDEELESKKYASGIDS